VDALRLSHLAAAASVVVVFAAVAVAVTAVAVAVTAVVVAFAAVAAAAYVVVVVVVVAVFALVAALFVVGHRADAVQDGTHGAHHGAARTCRHSKRSGEKGSKERFYFLPTLLPDTLFLK
jgi:fatty acid desaturase